MNPNELSPHVTWLRFVDLLKPIRYCENCGARFVVDGFMNPKKRFCSMQCSQSGRFNSQYKHGLKSNSAAWARLQRKRHPEKIAARDAVRYAIRRGLLVRQPCSVCGTAKTEGHHTDYTKPLVVVWLCKKHHVEADKLQRLESLIGKSQP